MGKNKKRKKALYIAITGGTLMVAAVLVLKTALFGRPFDSRTAESTRRASNETVPIPTPPPEAGNEYVLELDELSVADYLYGKISEKMEIDSLEVKFNGDGIINISISAPKDKTLELMRGHVSSGVAGALKLISLIAPQMIPINLSCAISVVDSAAVVTVREASVFNQKLPPESLPEGIEASVSRAVNDVVLKEGYEVREAYVTEGKITVSAELKR